MADTQTVAGTALPASALDRAITRADRALVAWSARREFRHSERRVARSDVLANTEGILDLDAPRAVRSFGFMPGAYR
jgi:hypothetical protein